MAYSITPYWVGPGGDGEIWVPLKGYFVDTLDQVTDRVFTAWNSDGGFCHYRDGQPVAQKDWPPDYE